MLGLGGLLFVCGILTHCMCTMTDRAAEQCNDIVPIEPVSIFYTAQRLADTDTNLVRSWTWTLVRRTLIQPVNKIVSVH